MVISLISLVFGIASLLYFVGYALWAGINSFFTFIWVVFGVFGIFYSFMHQWILQRDSLVLKRLEQVFLGIICIGLFIFCAVLLLLIFEKKKEPVANADYIVILGAHVYGERMSTNLRYRVDEAYEYLKNNPQTKVILSGGQGSGEDISEAEAMRRYLADKGIVQERMLLEDTSVNTDENIRNSALLIGDKKKSVIFVSNDFHIFRAKGIARKQGYENVGAIGSQTHAFTAPNCYIREAIAVIKYKICGQLK